MTPPPEKVRYAELLPHEFCARLEHRAIAYLPLGTLEWHGEHLPLGTDAIISEDLMCHCARELGGIVMPPLYVGPDRSLHDEEGNHLQGMDLAETTCPHRQLVGSCYWVPHDLFRYLIDCLLAQLQRAGFKAVFADGHGPSRYSWVSEIDDRETHFDLKLLGVTEAYGGKWRSQMDHGACNETSMTLAARPDLVDLSRLPEERYIMPQGVSGLDPRDASAPKGKTCRDICIELVSEMLTNVGL